MAGTITQARPRNVNIGKDAVQRFYQIIEIDFVGDGADGSVPDFALDLTGYLTKIVWVPDGADAGTSFELLDPLSADLDVLGGAGDALGTSPKQFVPVVDSVNPSPAPLILGGTYTGRISGNSTGSAGGKLQLWLTE